ncbi:MULTISPECIES: amidase family protein [unclassified Brevibacterium]|uniref:amidase family protein n=1 Tax=unclassified Brevibacterium TaxID=2614124 RepID=UPI001091CBDD|nr:amidase family protein [Brevibacterium sp. S22]TGD32249.1 amidase [Brevibacterium sp. S22]
MSEEMLWWSTRELAAQIAAKEVSAREALQVHLDRIDEVNPALNAVVTRDDEAAFAQAEAADAAAARDESFGPLHGVPMTHKDTHDTAGMRTTWGSPLMADHMPESDALIVARLRAAGITTTGKTNVPEFAAGSHTFNELFGTTVNPYDRTKSASGSSGGVGAVLAAGIQASGDGSDMGGSLRSPASFNNVVGLRPSNGRIPHVPPGNPYAWLSQSGFMARTVSDVALLMSVAAGPHASAPGSTPDPGGLFDLPEFALGADRSPDLTGLRVGFNPDLGGLLPIETEVAEIVASTAPVFSDLGAHVDAQIPNLTDADEVFNVRRALDFVSSWGGLYEAHPDMIKESVRWNIRMGLDLTGAEVASAESARSRLHSEIDRYFTGHDVLVLTTCQVLPFDAGIEYPTQINGVQLSSYLDWMRALCLISATGCPAISVPAGFSESGLPVGVQIVAKPGADVELLRVAHAFEAATGHHSRRPAL